MDETRKSNQRRRTQPLYQRILRGTGIDIGCGQDIITRDNHYPLITNCEPFDVQHGDAQYIDQYRPNEAYDFVYSSNCLEHLPHPRTAILSWFKLVKRGGHLIVSVPDEDLYEQGHFPSRYNGSHLWTFTIHKRKSWSPKSINVIELVQTLDGQVLRLDLIDTGYDYSLRDVDQTMPPVNAEAFIELVVRKD